MNAPRQIIKTSNLPFPVALWDDLASVDPFRAASKAGGFYNQGVFTIDFLNAPYLIDTAAKCIVAPEGCSKVSLNKSLVLLVYLFTCGKTEPPAPAGRLVGPMEIPGGAMFFRGPHALPTPPLAKAFGHNSQALTEKALALGAERESDPKALFKWQVLPKIEIALYFDEADDEFEAFCQYGFDAHIHFYLPLDAIWALTNVVTAELLISGCPFTNVNV
ncbi:MAG: DUF3786 domain-containing protein [Deltaproteobacteria bacterium]|jgi:hypothetical protein|nr:DUF3786 domain-containing protein [Deltaproteobacteria bacterium]